MNANIDTTIFFPSTMHYSRMLRWLGERYFAYRIIQWSGVAPERVGIATVRHCDNRNAQLSDLADSAVMCVNAGALPYVG